MSFLLQSGLVSWLASYLLHSSIIIGTALLVLHLFRGLSPVSRDVLLKTALVAGILSTSLQFILSAKGEYLTVYLIHAPIAGPKDSLAALPNLTGSAASTVAGSVSTSPGAMALILMVWIAGVAVTLGLFLWRWIQFRRFLGHLQPPSNTHTANVCLRLCKEMNIKRQIHLLETPSLISPIAMGFSTICLPTTTSDQYSSHEFEAILAHELAHLKRRDPLWLIFFHFMAIAFFFQPLNRLLQMQFQSESEYLSDAIATAHIDDDQALVKGLAKAASMALNNRYAGFASALIGHRATLSSRAEAILTMKRQRTRLPALTCSLFLLAITGVSSTFLPALALTGASSDIASALEASPSAAWNSFSQIGSGHFSNMNAGNIVAGARTVVFAKNVEFGTNMQGLSSLGNQGELFLAEQDLFSSKSLHIKKAASGEVMYTFRDGERLRDDPARAENFLLDFQKRYLGLRMTRQGAQALVTIQPAFAGVIAEATVNSEDTLSPNMDEFSRIWKKYEDSLSDIKIPPEPE